MTDGYSEKIEVETVIAAAGHLASPGDGLHGVAHEAIETFRRLDYGNQRAAADLLAARLEGVLKEWETVIATFVEK